MTESSSSTPEDPKPAEGEQAPPAEPAAGAQPGTPPTASGADPAAGGGEEAAAPQSPFQPPAPQAPPQSPWLAPSAPLAPPQPAAWAPPAYPPPPATGPAPGYPSQPAGQPEPWAPAAPAPTPAYGASSWPAGWGTPPPVWNPPAPATSSSAANPRRPMYLTGAAMLAVGLTLGAVGTAMFTRDTVNGSHTATLLVDDTPAKQGGSGNAESVAHQLGPAVGTIVAKASGSSALGSGFVIAHDGSNSYLLTNNHVVQGATELHVVMPGGRNLKASVVGTDSFDDLAVISVPDNSLPVATFGNSTKLVVGQAVVAIGSPLGNEGSVTEGVISALHRTISAGSDVGGQTETLQDVMQTDASINRGNSGGPLADVAGHVVGVNVAIAGDASNIGYSIPASLAENVAQELIRHEKVQHPFLGITYLTSIEAVEDGEGFDGPGVLVRDVSPGSPAEKAGFRHNDILEAVDGVSIDNGQTLGGLIQQHHVGDAVSFSVKRGGNVVKLTATLVDRPTGTQ